MRQGVLSACVLLGCTFDSGAAGGGAESMLGPVTSSGSGMPDSSTGAGPEPGTTTTTGATATATTSGGVGSTSLATATAGDPKSSATSETSGEGPVMLSDEGLVARYFLDEAGRGTSPMLALDSASEDPAHLTLSYDDRSLRYVSTYGNRGLAFERAGADDGARIPISGSKFEGIDGITALTFEVVVRLDSSINDGSRLVHFGGNGSGVAALSSRNANQLQLAWNDRVVREWDYSDFGDGEAHVLHAIADTSAVSGALRFRLLVDGQELPPTASMPVAQDEAASFSGNGDFALGNRNQDRAMQGILFYAAVYGSALAESTIAAHVPALLVNNDSPD
jgi:hypothetical protein